MGFFKNAMADLASRKGARKLKTTITRKGEDGSITLTVKGVVCTDAETLADKAEEFGATISAKGGDFQAAEGSIGGSLVDADARESATARTVAQRRRQVNLRSLLPRGSGCQEPRRGYGECRFKTGSTQGREQGAT